MTIQVHFYMDENDEEKFKEILKKVGLTFSCDWGLSHN